FVGAEWPAKRSAKLIPLKERSGALVEEIGRIECVVAQKLEGRSVELVAAGSGGNNDLTAGALAKLGAIGVPLHIEFAHCVDAQHHAARPAGLHVVFGGAGVLDAIQKENILLGAIAGDGEIVGGGGVRDACAASFLRSEIDDARIERKKQI